jgi:hypothetical protein
MNTCPISHKQCYPNPESAWKTLNLLNSPRALFTHKRKGKDGFVYRCPHCKEWHLTSQHKRSPKVEDWKARKRQLTAWRFHPEPWSRMEWRP